MEMIMTNELANSLMEDLICVAISAMGGVIVNEDGSFDSEQMNMAEEYAKKAFCDILGVWEKFNGTKWKIEVGA